MLVEHRTHQVNQNRAIGSVETSLIGIPVTRSLLL